MIVTTTIFVWLSNQVAQATTVMTTWICGTKKGSDPSSLPTHNVNASASPNAGTSGTVGSPNILTPSGRSTAAAASPSESLPLVSDNERDELKDENDQRVQFEPDTPIRPLRWVDRLAESSPTTRNGDSEAFLSNKKEWLKVGLVGKISIGFVIMWILNLMWPTAEAA